MPRFCAVFGCSNRSNREVDRKFFYFPGIRDRRGRDIPEGVIQRQAWIQSIKRTDLDEKKIKHATVCSDHFVTGRPALPNDALNPDYVPSQKMGYVSSKRSATTARYVRAKRRNIELVTKEQPLTRTEDVAHAEVIISTSHDPQNDQTPHLSEDVLLNHELYQLRHFKKNSTFEQSSFIDDDVKTRYFTGIPTYKALNSIYSRLIENHIKIAPHSLIKDKFKHFLITIMKLRLNLDFTFLAYLFQTSIQTISRIFYATIKIMYFRLKRLIIWPTREQLVTTMPRCFKEAFGDDMIAVIIDCFEIKMEKSKSLQVQATTWSSYKHSNTIKILIGIAPCGAISYISAAYGGRISDKGLTEDCGILNNLNPGDIVLADRGFLIEDLVGIHLAKVITPAFLKGKRQLDIQDVQSTRNLASVRIHVERVIGVLRQKYTILQDIIPMFLAKKKTVNTAVIDEILAVCCALVNLCPPIV